MENLYYWIGVIIFWGVWVVTFIAFSIYFLEYLIKKLKYTSLLFYYIRNYKDYKLWHTKFRKNK